MSSSEITPCYALFKLMKQKGGLNYKELASRILSGRPLKDGKSPASKVNDKSWISRFVVHAPMGSLPESYFGNFSTSALWVISGLKSKKAKAMTGQQIIDMLCGEDGQEIERALAFIHQDVALYRNVMTRIQFDNGFSVDERAEMVMVLVLCSACTGDVRRAAMETLSFSKSIHGSSMATPLITPSPERLKNYNPQNAANSVRVGLLRVVDGYVASDPYWLDPLNCPVEIGSLALEAGSINDVEPDVSSIHARFAVDEAGNWFIEGNQSKNGTILIPGTGKEKVIVEPSKSDREGFESHPIQIHAGDEIILGKNTHYVVIEGLER